jgi:hypothetical protein
MASKKTRKYKSNKRTSKKTSKRVSRVPNGNSSKTSKRVSRVPNGNSSKTSKRVSRVPNGNSSKKSKIRKQHGGNGEKFSIEVYEFLLAGYPIDDHEYLTIDGGIDVGTITTDKPIVQTEYFKLSDKEISRFNSLNSDMYSSNDNKIYSPDIVFNSEQAGGWTKGLFHEYYNTYKPKTKKPEPSVLFNGNHKEKVINLLEQLLEKTTILQNQIYKNPESMIHNEGFIYKTKVKNTEKVITFGDFHGSYHTFFRHMIRLETLGILTFEPSESSESIDSIDKLVGALTNNSNSNSLDLDKLPKITITHYYRLLFLGDILDRGMHALEIVIFILILIKSNNQEENGKPLEEPRIIYNRGNHEEYMTYKDFRIEYKSKIGNDDTKYKAFKKFFTSCPSAVILQNGEDKSITNIWCCHGGIPYYNKYNKYKNLREFINKDDKFFLINKQDANQIRWNDLIKSNINLRLHPKLKDTRGNIKYYRYRNDKKEPVDEINNTGDKEPISENNEPSDHYKEGHTVPEWGINQNTLKQILEKLKIDFLIRGHQDFYANTVLFVNKNDKNDKNDIEFDNGLDIQDIINPNATEKKGSTLSSNIDEFKNKVNPISRIDYIDNNTQLLYEFKQRENNKYNDKIKELKAITISTNTDINKPFTRDSFVIINFKQITN